MSAETRQAPPQPEISFEDFLRLDIRVGTITRADVNEGARKPALRLWLDFGPVVGERQSSAQLAANYTPEELIGRQVLAVVNFAPRRINGFRSDVLVLGVSDAAGEVVLITPERAVPDGGRLY
ncbi:MAG: tRNA-binding protein [Paracoccus sp. (in: a-proteobacteria)]|nr:tRNA-binding protein [Paracoccus sp. (in: a-proteobacteria)]